MRNRILAVVLVAAMLILPGAALGRLMVGQAAPDWSMPDTAWVNHTLSQYRGQVVLLNFWQQF